MTNKNGDCLGHQSQRWSTTDRVRRTQSPFSSRASRGKMADCQRKWSSVVSWSLTMMNVSNLFSSSTVKVTRRKSNQPQKSIPSYQFQKAWGRISADAWKNTRWGVQVGWKTWLHVKWKYHRWNTRWRNVDWQLKQSNPFTDRAKWFLNHNWSSLDKLQIPGTLQQKIWDKNNAPRHC